MPKVSVLIPVYGVEKYIRRCAVSLFEQTLEEVEYILLMIVVRIKVLVFWRKLSRGFRIAMQK